MQRKQIVLQDLAEKVNVPFEAIVRPANLFGRVQCCVGMFYLGCRVNILDSATSHLKCD